MNLCVSIHLVDLNLYHFTSDFIYVSIVVELLNFPLFFLFQVDVTSEKSKIFLFFKKCYNAVCMKDG